VAGSVAVNRNHWLVLILGVVARAQPVTNYNLMLRTRINAGSDLLNVQEQVQRTEKKKARKRLKAGPIKSRKIMYLTYKSSGVFLLPLLESLNGTKLADMSAVIYVGVSEVEAG